tara:strand:- start:2002 stop:3264 length:1263 start_codon:yes stop_codon:yes gene_type:complete
MIYTVKQRMIDNLIVFMLIMSTGGLLFVFNRNLSYLIFFTILGFSFSFLGKKLKKITVFSSILTSLLIVSLFLINYIFAFTEQTDNKYLYYLMVVSASILTLLFFHNNRTKNIMIERVYFVLKIITFHSILNFIAFFIIGNRLSIITSMYHECETFLNIFFYTTERGIVTLFGVEICRNQGLFWEPGVLQAFLNVFFFLEAFILKRNRLLLLVVSFAILSTYSTTGLALLLIQGIVYFRSESKNNKVLLPIIIVLSIPVYLAFSVNVEEKVQGEKEASFQKRLFDLTQPFFIALEHPLTGIGLDLEQFQKMRSEFHFSSNSLQSLEKVVGIDSKATGTDKGSSNSIMFLLASMGFPTAFLFLYMFFKQQIITRKKWLIMLILTISVMSEPLLLRPFFFIFIISGFTHYFHRITSHKQQLA